MDLAFNAEELAFQKEVRDWITANMPPEVAEESRRSRSSHVSKERLLLWQKKLAQKGWLCPNWPKEYGGRGVLVNCIAPGFIETAMTEVITPEQKEKLLATGVEAVGSTPEQFSAFFTAETRRWAPIVKASGFTPDD